VTTLERITAILERARVAGGWIDEDVAAQVLAEMRRPTEAMTYAAWEHLAGAYSHERITEAVRAMLNERLDDDGKPSDRASPNLGHG
jgi:hypothetical protein